MGKHPSIFPNRNGSEFSVLWWSLEPLSDLSRVAISSSFNKQISLNVIWLCSFPTPVQECKCMLRYFLWKCFCTSYCTDSKQWVNSYSIEAKSSQTGLCNVYRAVIFETAKVFTGKRWLREGLCLSCKYKNHTLKKRGPSSQLVFTFLPLIKKLLYFP